MNLDLINDLFNNLKDNKFMQNFMNELSDYLENNSNIRNEEVPIIEDILCKNNLTTGNENSIRLKAIEIIKNYSEKLSSNKPIYFIRDNKKTYWLNNIKHYNNDVYAVLKVENRKIDEIEISKKEMPKGIGVNDVFRIENNNYIIDKKSTKELQEEIKNVAKEVIDKQNINLEKFRKEGHLYLVTEEIGDNRFLWDLTEKNKNEFEEVNISKELLNKATEGAVLKYTNGAYEYYSDNGFEMIEKINKI